MSEQEQADLAEQMADEIAAGRARRHPPDLPIETPGRVGRWYRMPSSPWSRFRINKIEGDYVYHGPP